MMSGGDLEMFAYRNAENLLGIKAARLTQGQKEEANITGCHGTPSADVLLPFSKAGTSQLLLPRFTFPHS
jgi:hypothetical protein